MIETAIFAQWQHNQNQPLYYSRWTSGEVDIVTLNENQKPQWCIEIKWTNRFAKNPSELKSLNFFCKKHQLKDAIITTIDITDKMKINNSDYVFIPASLYAYTVGRNIIQGKETDEYT